MITLLVTLSLFTPFLLFRPKDVFQPEFFLNLYFIALIGLGPLSLNFLLEETYRTGNYAEILELIAIGYFSINFGFLLQQLFSDNFKLKRTPALQYSANLSTQRNLTKALKALGIIFAIISATAATLYFVRAGGIPLLAENKEEARVAALSVPGNGYLLYLMTLGILAPALILTHYKNFQLSKFSKYKTLMVATTALGLLLIFTGSRRYTLWMFIYLIAIHHYSRSKISIPKMIALAVGGICAINLFEMIRNPFSDTTTNFGTASLYRFVVYISNFEKVFTTFLNHEKLYGSTLFMDIATIAPGKQIDYQSWLKDLVGLDFEGFGIPPTLMGDMYINFDYPGVVVGCILFGYLMRSLYRHYVLKGRSFLGIIFYISCLEIGSKIITSGLSAQMVGILWLVTLYSAIYIFIRFIKRNTNDTKSIYY